MNITKQTQTYNTMPRADLDGDGDADAIRATIYVKDQNETAAVIAYAPDSPLAPDALDFAHELAHILRNQDNDELHHPWWHFCGLVGHTVRTRRHLTRRERDGGRRVHAARPGEVVVV